MSTFGQRVKEIRKESGLNQTAFGKKVGLSQGTLSEIERGDYSESIKTPAMAEFCKVNVKWLATGKGPKRPNETGSHAEGFDLDVFVAVPKVAVKFAGGKGYLADHVEIDGSHIYRKSFIKQLGCKPENLFVAEATDYSMFPLISQGDSILGDRSRREPAEGRIFAFRDDGELRMKRFMQRKDGIWEIHSENVDKKKYPTETLTEDRLESIEIIGLCLERSGLL